MTTSKEGKSEQHLLLKYSYTGNNQEKQSMANDFFIVEMQLQIIQIFKKWSQM